MELRQLEYFYTINKCEGMSKAAAALHVTQPTLTTAIRNLELELGVLLFDRGKGGLKLTDAGRIVLDRASIILNNVSLIHDDLHEYRTGKPRHLSIAVPPISFAGLYPLLLKDFAEAHPDISIHLSDICNHEALDQLKLGNLDLGFVVEPEIGMPLLGFIPIKNGSIFVLMSKDHPLAGRPSVDYKDLIAEKIFMYKEGTSYIELRMKKEFLAHGLNWNIYQYFTNFNLIYDLVAQNLGIAFAMRTDSITLGRNEGLVEIPFTQPVNYTLSLAYPNTRELPGASKELLNFVRERILNVPGRTLE